MGGSGVTDSGGTAEREPSPWPLAPRLRAALGTQPATDPLDALQAVQAVDAVSERQRRYWRRQEERESTTLVGLMVTLAEHRAQVTVHLDGGGSQGVRFVGRLVAAGTDVVSMACTDGRLALIALDAVVMVRPTAADEHTGDRQPTARGRFNETIAELCGDQPDVVVHLMHGEAVRGRLRWCGDDVCCLDLARGTVARTPAYIPLAAVSALTTGGQG